MNIIEEQSVALENKIYNDAFGKAQGSLGWMWRCMNQKTRIPYRIQCTPISVHQCTLNCLKYTGLQNKGVFWNPVYCNEKVHLSFLSAGHMYQKTDCKTDGNYANPRIKGI